MGVFGEGGGVGVVTGRAAVVVKSVGEDGGGLDGAVAALAEVGSELVVGEGVSTNRRKRERVRIEGR